MKDAKWYFIMVAVAFAAMFGGMAVEGRAKAQAKQAIVVACYQAGNKDCEKAWKED